MANEQMISAFGEVKSISDWHRDGRCAVTYKTLYARLADLDWMPEDAITTPRLRLCVEHRVTPPNFDATRETWISGLDPGF